MLLPAADVPVEQPLKARLQSEDGRQVVSVVVRLASTIKPTFTQASPLSTQNKELQGERVEKVFNSSPP